MCVCVCVYVCVCVCVCVCGERKNAPTTRVPQRGNSKVGSFIPGSGDFLPKCDFLLGMIFFRFDLKLRREKESSRNAGTSTSNKKRVSRRMPPFRETHSSNVNEPIKTLLNGARNHDHALPTELSGKLNGATKNKIPFSAAKGRP